MPNLYNNQNELFTPHPCDDTTEMNHDPDIVPTAAPARQREPAWDLIGYWQGDTLVVETVNFGEFRLIRANKILRLLNTLARTRRRSALLCCRQFRNLESTPGGRILMVPGPGKLYEFACHEGNYALGNILRGARELERDALASGE